MIRLIMLIVSFPAMGVISQVVSGDVVLHPQKENRECIFSVSLDDPLFAEKTRPGNFCQLLELGRKKMQFRLDFDESGTQVVCLDSSAPPVPARFHAYQKSLYAEFLRFSRGKLPLVYEGTYSEKADEKWIFLLNKNLDEVSLRSAMMLFLDFFRQDSVREASVPPGFYSSFHIFFNLIAPFKSYNKSKA